MDAGSGIDPREDPFELFSASSTPATALPLYDRYDSRKEALLVGDEPVQVYRNQLDPKHINPWLNAMAKAARFMPRIEKFALNILVSKKTKSTFSVTYSREDKQSSESVKKVEWDFSPKGFKLEDETIKIWMESKDLTQERASVGIPE